MNRKCVLAAENEFGLNYEVFYPADYTGLPLLVYLHGAGERGGTLEHVNRHGVPKLILEGLELPAVVLCPQCPQWAVWDNVVRDVKGVIDCVAREFSVEKDRICITGSSMGGYGTWMMGETYTNFFSAIGPVAGGGIAWRTPNLRSTPVLAVHGTADDVVLPVCSELMVNGVLSAGGCAKLISLEGLGHNDGIDYAYRSTELIEWLLKQRRTDFSPVPEYCSEYF